VTDACAYSAPIAHPSPHLDARANARLGANRIIGSEDLDCKTRFMSASANARDQSNTPWTKSAKTGKAGKAAARVPEAETRPAMMAVRDDLDFDMRVGSGSARACIERDAATEKGHSVETD
jgi:hypothetical protein